MSSAPENAAQCRAVLPSYRIRGKRKLCLNQRVNARCRPSLLPKGSLRSRILQRESVLEPCQFGVQPQEKQATNGSALRFER